MHVRGSEGGVLTHADTGAYTHSVELIDGYLAVVSR